MSRLPALGFGALVGATVGAFFITQHLKATTPLIAGSPMPDPAAINPYGNGCRTGQHRFSRFSFYLLHSSDRVDIGIVDSGGHVVRTIAVDHPMRRGVRHPDGDFRWDGRDVSGRVVAEGRYFIRVHLRRQNRTVTISGTAGPEPITVITQPPRPVISRVAPRAVAVTGGEVRIDFGIAGSASPVAATIDIFRIAGDRPHLVKRFRVRRRATHAVWDVRVHGAPAVPGVYLVGMDAVDAACNVGRFPPQFPPDPLASAALEVIVRRAF